jgi:hypothetical protein
VAKRPGYTSGAFLLAVGIVFAVVGVGLFPWPVPPPRPSAAQISVYDDWNIAELDYAITPLAHGRDRVTLKIFSSIPRLTTGSNQIVLDWDLPRGEHAIRGTSGTSRGGTVISRMLPTNRKTGEDASVTTETFVADGASVEFIKRGASVAAELPSLEANGIDIGDPNPESGANGKHPTYAQIQLPIENSTNTSWQTNPPDTVGANDAKWAYYLTSTASRRVDGTDLSVQGSEQFQGFVAGALVALAGSALIGAVPEIIHERALRPNRVRLRRVRRRERLQH